MNTQEILTALQFVSALEKEQGISVSAQEVKLGRLEINGVEKKESGYVCFYCIIDGKIYWLKAFKGKTERLVKCGTENEEVVVLKEFAPVCFFKSAYKNTTWKVNKGPEGIYLTIGKM